MSMKPHKSWDMFRERIGIYLLMGFVHYFLLLGFRFSGTML